MAIVAFFGFLNTPPFFDLKQKLPDGTYPLNLYADFLGANGSDPYYFKEYSNSIENKIDAIQSFDANYEVNKFLELDAKYGINYQDENTKLTFLNQSKNANSNYYGNGIGVDGPDNTGEIINKQYKTTSINFLGSANIHVDLKNDFNMRPSHPGKYPGFI